MNTQQAMAEQHCHWNYKSLLQLHAESVSSHCQFKEQIWHDHAVHGICTTCKVLDDAVIRERMALTALKVLVALQYPLCISAGRLVHQVISQRHWHEKKCNAEPAARPGRRHAISGNQKQQHT